MQRWMAARSLIGALTLIVSLVCGSWITSAQDAPLPEVGSIIVADPLLQRGVLNRSACPTGLNANRFTAEGYRLAVTGLCFDDRPDAFTFQQMARLHVPDGKVQLEARAETDLDRIRFGFAFRVQPNNSRYAAVLQPGQGSAQLVRYDGEQSTVLAERSDLGQFMTEWTTIAVRTQGPRMWLLLDNQPVLMASDATYADGVVWLALTRLGDPSDTQESAVTVRNLRVSQLATGDLARVPTYEPFPPPPPLGDVVFEDPLTRPGIAVSTSCPTGLGATEFVGEGYLLKVHGRCTQPNDAATVGQRFQGLTISDGEVSVEMRVANGGARARVLLQARRHPSDPDNYYVGIEPVHGWVQLLKIKGRNPAVVLDQQIGAADSFSPDGWNSIALRLQGSHLWLLVNDEPILAATDADLESGGVGLQLRRLGAVEDDQETAVVFRNLRVSSLADGDPSRAPRYQQP